MKQPFMCTWVEGSLRPLPRYYNVAARQLGEEGSQHLIAIAEERTQRSHNHYFAALHEAWLNLPEDVAAKYFDEDDFRARLLVEAGYLGPVRFVSFTDNEQAAKAAAFAPVLTPCVCSVVDNVVAIRKVKSQSLSAMGKEEFERSKRDVLDLAASMINVPLGQLKQNAGRSA